MKSSLVLVTVAMAATAAFAQSPYSGMQTRSIKALSEEQIADLKEGRGMGLALAAELNGYPGPSHVLELADKLQLTADQRSQVQRLFDAMKAEALPIGERLLEQEGELDHLFASRTITVDRLKATTTAIAATQGELRETHLRYHLLTIAVLNPLQLRRYGDLRGYQGQDDHDEHGGHHHN